MSVAMLAQQSGAKTMNPGLTEHDRIVSETMMNLWSSFARTGIPQAKGIYDWLACSTDSDRYLYIGQDIEVRAGYSRVAQQETARAYRYMHSGAFYDSID